MEDEAQDGEKITSNEETKVGDDNTEDGTRAVVFGSAATSKVPWLGIISGAVGLASRCSRAR